MRGEHLKENKRTDYDFSKCGAREPVYLNKELDHKDLYFEILDKREATEEEKIAQLVTKVNLQLNTLQKSLI